MVKFCRTGSNLEMRNIVSRPFGIGDLKENWFLLFSN
jgi:hypothetical protein